MELATEQPFEVSDCIVVPAQGLVIGPKGQETLGKRFMSMLVVLARHAPDPAPTDEILKEAWNEDASDQVVLNGASAVRNTFAAVCGVTDLIPRGEQPYRLNAEVNFDDVLVPSTNQCPYKALSSFESNDRIYFAGRSADSDAILKQLQLGCGFVLIVGASGVGKSSLLRAALLPTHKRELGYQGKLIDCKAESANTLLEKLRMDRPKKPQFVALDHLELMFSSAYTTEEQQQIATQLHDLTQQPKVRIVACMRADYYGDIARVPMLTQLVQGSGTHLLGNLMGKALRDVIIRPAALAGLSFEGSAGSNATLADQILEDAHSHDDQLPLLSLLLTRLYDQRDSNNQLTYQAYNTVGGYDGCLTQHAEACYQSLPPDQQAQLTQVLLTLTIANAETVTTIAVPLAAFSTQQQQLIQQFVDQRLCQTLQTDGSAKVAIAHESLLRHWPRANRIIEQHKADLGRRADIRQGTERWLRANKAPGYLLSQTPYQQVRGVCDNPSIRLDPDEQQFLERSSSAIRRTQFLRRFGVLTLALLLGFAAVSSWRLELSREAADQARQSADESFAILEHMLRETDPGTLATADKDSLVGIAPADLLDSAREALSSGNYNADVYIRVALSLAEIYQNHWQLAPVAELLAEAEQQIANSPGVDNFSSVRLYNAQGKLAYYQHDYDQADKLYQKSSTLLGSQDNPGLRATIENNLGELRLAQGKYSQAQKHHELALSIRQRLYPNGQQRVGESLHNLAGVHKAAGAFDRAGELYQQAITMQRQILGATHPELATAMTNLGVLRMGQGNLDEAEPLLTEALEIRRNSYGDDHPQTANSLHNLAAFAVQSGDQENAERLSEQSIDQHRKLFGKQHIAVAAGLNNLAKLYIEQARYTEAEKLLNQAVQDFTQKGASPHPYAGYFYYNLAVSELELGKTENAMLSNDQALNALPPDHPDRALFKTLSAEIQHQQGLQINLNEMLIQPLATIAKTKGTDSVAFSVAVNRAANILKVMPDEELRRALESYGR